MNASVKTESQYEGQLKMEKAIAQVDRHANERWKEAALASVQAVCETKHLLTTDDIWWVLDRLRLQHSLGTHEPRAMGSIVRQAARKGWMVPTSEYIPSERPESHRRPIRIWASRIYIRGE